MRSASSLAASFVTVLVMVLTVAACGVVEELTGPPRWEGNEVVWDGAQFVALGFREHWTSADGREWTHVEGTPLVAATQWRCPDGFDCDVDGTPGSGARSDGPEPVPFHYARAFGSPVAAGADRVLFSRQFQYSPFQDWLPEQQADGDQPVDGGQPVHPDLLRLAAEREDCFARLLDEQTAGIDRGVELDSWGITGRSDGWRVTLRCRSDDAPEPDDDDEGAGTGTVVFTERLAPYLDEDDRARLDQLPRQLWIEAADGSVSRVAQPPLTEFWAEGRPGGRLIATVSKVASSGRRFWSTDRGRLVVSDDGSSWSELQLQTGGAPVDGQAMEAYATFGGHVAVVVVDDARLPRRGEARWLLTNNDGGTWSEVDGPPFSWLPRLAVGPVGLLWSSDEAGYRLATTAGETINIPVGQPTGQPAVGPDRLVVHDYSVDDGDGVLRSYVFDPSGTLLFEIDR